MTKNDTKGGDDCTSYKGCNAVPECPGGSWGAACDCSIDSHCDICQNPSTGGIGCTLCNQGYFEFDYNYPCTQCQEIFGNECLHCTNLLGCQQCDNNCQRIQDPNCGLWWCDCNDINITQVAPTTTDTNGDIISMIDGFLDGTDLDAYLRDLESDCYACIGDWGCGIDIFEKWISLSGICDLGSHAIITDTFTNGNIYFKTF